MAALSPAALQRAGTLSGGQQQRVAICRALTPPASFQPEESAACATRLRSVWAPRRRGAKRWGKGSEVIASI
jgi:hypothetical protein